MSQLSEEKIGEVLLLLLMLAAAWMLWPLWPALMLAAWTAIVARPLRDRLCRVLGSQPRAALATTLIILLGVVLPLIALIIPLVVSAIDLVKSLIESGKAERALELLLQGGSSTGVPEAEQLANEAERSLIDTEQLIALAQEHGERALGWLSAALGSTVTVALSFLVFLLGLHEFLARGERFSAWLQARLPLPELVCRRLGAVFVETGRGLFVGVGLTSLLQGAIATVSYLLLGVPRALVLGALTTVTSLLPAVGTGLVWLPVSVALWMAGRPGAAITMALIGALVVGSVDNFLRPVFARYGNFRLDGFVTMLAMFGALTAVGPWGVLVGPLLVRMGVEAVELWHERRV